MAHFQIPYPKYELVNPIENSHVIEQEQNEINYAYFSNNSYIMRNVETISATPTNTAILYKFAEDLSCTPVLVDVGASDFLGLHIFYYNDLLYLFYKYNNDFYYATYDESSWNTPTLIDTTIPDKVSINNFQVSQNSGTFYLLVEVQTATDTYLYFSTDFGTSWSLVTNSTGAYQSTITAKSDGTVCVAAVFADNKCYQSLYTSSWSAWTQSLKNGASYITPLRHPFLMTDTDGIIHLFAVQIGSNDTVYKAAYTGLVWDTPRSLGDYGSDSKLSVTLTRDGIRLYCSWYNYNTKNESLDYSEVCYNEIARWSDVVYGIYPYESTQTLNGWYTNIQATGTNAIYTATPTYIPDQDNLYLHTLTNVNNIYTSSCIFRCYVSELDPSFDDWTYLGLLNTMSSSSSDYLGLWYLNLLSLEDYRNKNIYFKFELVTAGTTVTEGYYFSNIKVIQKNSTKDLDIIDAVDIAEVSSDMFVIDGMTLYDYENPTYGLLAYNPVMCEIASSDEKTIMGFSLLSIIPNEKYLPEYYIVSIPEIRNCTDPILMSITNYKDYTADVDGQFWNAELIKGYNNVYYAILTWQTDEDDTTTATFYVLMSSDGGLTWNDLNYDPVYSWNIEYTGVLGGKVYDTVTRSVTRLTGTVDSVNRLYLAGEAEGDFVNGHFVSTAFVGAVYNGYSWITHDLINPYSISRLYKISVINDVVYYVYKGGASYVEGDLDREFPSSRENHYMINDTPWKSTSEIYDFSDTSSQLIFNDICFTTNDLCIAYISKADNHWYVYQMSTATEYDTSIIGNATYTNIKLSFGKDEVGIFFLLSSIANISAPGVVDGTFVIRLIDNVVDYIQFTTGDLFITNYQYGFGLIDDNDKIHIGGLFSPAPSNSYWFSTVIDSLTNPGNATMSLKTSDDLGATWETDSITELYGNSSFLLPNVERDGVPSLLGVVYDTSLDKYTGINIYMYRRDLYWSLHNAIGNIPEGEPGHNPMYYKDSTTWKRVRKLQNKQSAWEHNATFVKDNNVWRRVTV